MSAQPMVIHASNRQELMQAVEAGVLRPATRMDYVMYLADVRRAGGHVNCWSGGTFEETNGGFAFVALQPVHVAEDRGGRIIGPTIALLPTPAGPVTGDWTAVDIWDASRSGMGWGQVYAYSDTQPDSPDLASLDF